MSDSVNVEVARDLLVIRQRAEPLRLQCPARVVENNKNLCIIVYCL